MPGESDRAAGRLKALSLALSQVLERAEADRERIARERPEGFREQLAEIDRNLTFVREQLAKAQDAR
jgi:hypothetical protein